MLTVFAATGGASSGELIVLDDDMGSDADGGAVALGEGVCPSAAGGSRRVAGCPKSGRQLEKGEEIRWPLFSNFRRVVLQVVDVLLDPKEVLC